MDLELDKKLCELAPHLFADRYASMQTTCMCWGFDCGNGWYEIIKKAALELEPLIIECITKDPEGWQLGFYRAAQVKEKYGCLRFYLTAGTPKMYAIVDKAERQSSVTCEVCGKPGKIRGQGWLYTACNRHTKKEDKKCKKNA